MSTIVIIFAVILALILAGVYVIIIGGNLEKVIRKHLEDEFNMKTRQALDIIKEKRVKDEKEAERMFADIRVRIHEADMLKKGVDDIREKIFLSGKKEANDDIMNSLFEFINETYISKQTQKKLSAFVRHFYERRIDSNI